MRLYLKYVCLEALDPDVNPTGRESKIFILLINKSCTLKKILIFNPNSSVKNPLIISRYKTVQSDFYN